MIPKFNIPPASPHGPRGDVTPSHSDSLAAAHSSGKNFSEVMSLKMHGGSAKAARQQAKGYKTSNQNDSGASLTAASNPARSHRSSRAKPGVFDETTGSEETAGPEKDHAQEETSVPQTQAGLQASTADTVPVLLLTLLTQAPAPLPTSPEIPKSRAGNAPDAEHMDAPAPAIARTASLIPQKSLAPASALNQPPSAIADGKQNTDKPQLVDPSSPQSVSPSTPEGQPLVPTALPTQPRAIPSLAVLDASATETVSPEGPNLQALTGLKAAPKSRDRTSGTPAALSTQRMKLAEEKNEIAGRTVQKLPRTPTADESTADLADGDEAESSTAAPSVKIAIGESPSILNSSAKTGFEAPEQLVSADSVRSVGQYAAKAEHLGDLITREVMMIRQSGADSLAVSLKVDSHTELFLQLTNHDGQIHASVRCERGNVAGLDSHWGELQESLARQNVQLLPLENKFSARASELTSPSTTAASAPFNQSSQNPRQQTRDLPSDSNPVATVTISATTKTKTKAKTGFRNGWETWA